MDPIALSYSMKSLEPIPAIVQASNIFIWATLILVAIATILYFKRKYNHAFFILGLALLAKLYHLGTLLMMINTKMWTILWELRAL